MNSKQWKRHSCEKLKVPTDAVTVDLCYSCNNNFTQSGGLRDLLIVYPKHCLSEELQHSASDAAYMQRAIDSFAPSRRFDRFAGTSSHSPIVGLIIILIQLGGFRICWAGRIWIRKQRLNWCQYCTNIMARWPSILDDVHAQSSIMIYIRMEDIWGESHSRRLLGIIFPKNQSQAKNTTFPWSLIRTKDGSAPHKEVLFGMRTCATTLRRLVPDSLQVGHQPKLCRGRHSKSQDYC